MNLLKHYDVVVIGAGHAGIESALAAARLGASTAIFTLSLDAIGNLPCNPSIGGTAKGHLVFEIAALGGEMGRAADATALQCRMLNLTRGPAVHSLRMQNDRRAYHQYMKRVLEKQELLDLIQDEVVSVEVQQGSVSGVCTRLGAAYGATCVIVATGTYLNGTIYVGDSTQTAGPDGSVAATGLTNSLRSLGLPLRRFKTGTPARAHRRSIDFSKLTLQQGDEKTFPFDFMDDPPQNKVVCHIAHTNVRTHEIILRNLHRSPLYSGKIEGVGPRYCPSIEDKVVRFPDKNRHQVFVEPCGENTDEMYLQGMSSSLPLDVQMELYRTIEGFEKIELMRPAHAIEYDCCDPLAFLPTLQCKSVTGLYGAGQFNGTSGYEEAAAQGLVAGINAARFALGKDPFILTRDTSYIGTLIDDLTTKGTKEPYRMMTARSEYRLLLRQDNADRRLCVRGKEIGLLTEEKFAVFSKGKEMLDSCLEHLKKTPVPSSSAMTESLKTAKVFSVDPGTSLSALLRRPGVTREDIVQIDSFSKTLPPDVLWKSEIEVKYEGYLKRQQAAVDKMRRMETWKIPEEIDYRLITNLRTEARDKLEKVRPLSMGQAARISGVNPADISVLTVYLHKRASKSAKEKESGGAK